MATVTLRVVGGGQTTGRNLDFGTIAATQTVTVLPTATQAGRFTIQGRPDASVTFTIVDLPATFGPPGLVLSAWQGRHGAKSNPSQGTAFTPVEGGSLSLRLSNTGLYFVYIGATLTATNAPGGAYSVPIKVNIVFE